MIRVPRRVFRGLVLALVVISPVMIASSPAPTKDCESLLHWARAAFAQAPPTFDQLAAFDRPHRKAIFTAITPAARAALWREQSRRFVAREQLTPRQRAFVNDAIAKMTPQLYAQDRAVRAEVGRELQTRGETLFTRTQLAAWVDLAGPASDAHRAAAGLVEQLAQPFTAAAQRPWCQCSSISPWPECVNGGCAGADCDTIGPGCGWMGLYDCDGNCVQG